MSDKQHAKYSTQTLTCNGLSKGDEGKASAFSCFVHLAIQIANTPIHNKFLQKRQIVPRRNRHVVESVVEHARAQSEEFVDLIGRQPGGSLRRLAQHAATENQAELTDVIVEERVAEHVDIRIRLLVVERGEVA